jgi:hypothetical protein
MSAPRTPDDPRDPRFDTAWHAVSNEAPPARLDDAIRAAARREVGAGPTPVGAGEASRPGRWWWPLAAAATIGAIAIGLLQLAPEDRVASGGSDAGVVSDVPKVARKQDAREADRASGEEAQPRASAALAVPTPALEALEKRTPAAPPPATMQRQLADAASMRTPAQPEPAEASAELRSREASVSTAKAKVQSDGDEALRDKIEAASETNPEQRKELAAERAMPMAGAPVAASAPIPFPATGTPARSASASAERAASPATAPVATRADAKLAANAAAPATPAAAGFAEPARRAAPAQESRQNPLGKVTAGSDESGAKDGAARSPAEWIAQIRRLRAEGNFESAAKELVAFRAAYRDAELLLPQELRDWHPVPIR